MLYIVRTFSNTSCRTAAQQQLFVEQQLNSIPKSNSSSTTAPSRTAAQQQLKEISPDRTLRTTMSTQYSRQYGSPLPNRPL
ncbi:hypothetical protein AXF42_Ash010766 [Apostasia shenzhenica]|uniref:Uncharacterized protein n=1 Tax=Apostasia shenzhenica TaxID=1088818 RepID=A0A2I0A0L7_9ASPA|nr:hypothetical protein AXF42_Ash010766 [Apostasia shenzhenica]